MKNSPSPKKKFQISSKKLGKNFSKNKSIKSSWGAYLRKWYMDPASTLEEYKSRLEGKKWELAKCKCTDEKGNRIPYQYTPALNKDNYSKEGWWCPLCSKGHSK
jgi:hypothetical protein